MDVRPNSPLSVASVSSGSDDVGGSDSERSAPLPKPKYPLNLELDELWENCRLFAGKARDINSRIHPLDLALVLLFDGLQDPDLDPRLIAAKTEHKSKVERPLFWTAMSRARKFSPPESLDAHLQNHIYLKSDVEPSIHMSIGQAFWAKVQELDSPHFEPPSVNVDGNNVILEHCCEATRLVLDQAKTFADDSGDAFLAPHHLLLALFMQEDIKQILETDHHLDTKVLAAIVRDLRKENVSNHEEEPRFAFLNEFAIDVTKMMQDKLDKGEEIDPIVGRNYELRRLVSILSRLTKNNAVLLGDPGVGKTAIAEGLALRIIQGQVPESVVARVFSLDLGALLASTACKSAYEHILQRILDEIAQHEDRGINVILFIDELSQLTIGGYRGDGVGIDAATLMKPFLTAGKLRCVGCSTFEDFRMSIEKDGALARQFSYVYVCEPTVNETIKVLRGLKNGMEKFHGVIILDEAMEAAASIASQFFSHKRLPDSAIDLVDEACSYIKIGRNEKWERLGKLKRAQYVLQMNIHSWENEVDEASDKELEQAQQEMEDLERQIESFTTTTLKTRTRLTKLQELEDKIKDLEAKAFQLGQAGERAKKIETVQEIYKLESQRLEVGEDDEDSSSEDTPEQSTDSSENGPKLVLRRTVKEVASWHRPIQYAEPYDPVKRTGVLEIFRRLSKSVTGQYEAIDAALSAVRCMMGGLTDPSRPIASFLFGGPSGSGKTLLSKELTNCLLRSSGCLPGSFGKLVRINAADYAESHSLTRLIGTPACTGFDKGGQLTECVRRRPFSIVHIHDIENACPEFRLQIQTILDEGSLRDGSGKVVDFTNCIVIITTSIGQDTSGRAPPGEDEKQWERQHFLDAIHRYFPIEFLARLDDLVVFKRIDAEMMSSIVEARLEEIRKLLLGIKLRLEADDKVRLYLEMRGWSPISGARQLEKIIRSEILRPLSLLILENQVHDNWTVRLKHEGGRLIIEPGEPVAPIVDESSSSSNTGSSSPTTSYSELSVDSITAVGDTRDSSSTSVVESAYNNLPAPPPMLKLLPQRLF
ncbi:P-loop containing nucleoside triphosphate hydrolase protein [Sparassis latifolia]